MDVSADSYRFLIQKHSEAVNGVYKFITYAAPLHEEERGDGAVIEVEETAYYSW